MALEEDMYLDVQIGICLFHRKTLLLLFAQSPTHLHTHVHFANICCFFSLYGMESIDLQMKFDISTTE